MIGAHTFFTENHNNKNCVAWDHKRISVKTAYFSSSYLDQTFKNKRNTCQQKFLIRIHKYTILLLLTKMSRAHRGQARSEIQNLLKEKKVVVISKSSCPYCKMAKQVLAKYEIPEAIIEIREIDDDPQGDNIQNVMQELTGARTVPRIFIGGKCIGGGDEIMTMHNNGELEELLRSNAALI